MTTAPADTREVILATIRQRLLDDDAHVVRLDDASYDRHVDSIAEHALDAAIARGSRLADVHDAARAEVACTPLPGSTVDLDPDGPSPFNEKLDPVADLPFEQIGLVPPFPDAPERTLNDLRRSMTVRLLSMLTITIDARASRAVIDVFTARARELGLVNPQLGDVMDSHERVALFTAGLYGEEEP